MTSWTQPSRKMASLNIAKCHDYIWTNPIMSMPLQFHNFQVNRDGAFYGPAMATLIKAVFVCASRGNTPYNCGNCTKQRALKQDRKQRSFLRHPQEFGDSSQSPHAPPPTESQDIKKCIFRVFTLENPFPGGGICSHATLFMAANRVRYALYQTGLRNKYANAGFTVVK